MPDLGPYAMEVALAYGVSLALLVGLLGLSIAQARRAKRRLIDSEGRNSDG